MKNAILVASILLGFSHAHSEDSSTFCIRSLNLHGSLYFKSKGEGENLIKRLSDPQNSCSITHVKEVWVRSQKRELVDLLQTLGGGRLQPEFDSSRNDGRTIGMLSFVQGNVGEWGSVLFDVMQDDLKSTLTSFIGVRKGFSYVYLRVGPQEIPVLVVNAILSASSEEVRLAQISQLTEWLTSQMPFSSSVILTIKLNASPKSLEWRYLTRVLSFKDAFAVSLNCANCDRHSETSDYFFFQAHPTLNLTVSQVHMAEMGDDVQVRFASHFHPELSEIATRASDPVLCEARKRIARVTIDEAQRSIVKTRYIKLKHDLEQLRGSLEGHSRVADNLCGTIGPTYAPARPPPSSSVHFSKISQELFPPTH